MVGWSEMPSIKKSYITGSASWTKKKKQTIETVEKKSTWIVLYVIFC